MSGKHYIAELLPGNEALFRQQWFPDEHSQGFIDSLSVSAASIFPAIPVALGKLE